MSIIIDRELRPLAKNEKHTAENKPFYVGEIVSISYSIPWQWRKPCTGYYKIDSIHHFKLLDKEYIRCSIVGADQDEVDMLDKNEIRCIC